MWPKLYHTAPTHRISCEFSLSAGLDNSHQFLSKPQTSHSESRRLPRRVRNLLFNPLSSLAARTTCTCVSLHLRSHRRRTLSQFIPTASRPPNCSPPATGIDCIRNSDSCRLPETKPMAPGTTRQARVHSRRDAQGSGGNARASRYLERSSPSNQFRRAPDSIHRIGFCFLETVP
jgi:hypothetical protein